MNVSLKSNDSVSGVVTVAIEKNDYEAQVDKSLRQYRQKADMPGFRKGMVPLGLIKKMYDSPCGFRRASDTPGNKRLFVYILHKKTAHFYHEPSFDFPFSFQIGYRRRRRRLYLAAEGIAVRGVEI